jgi:hypothetical protein
MIYKHRAGTGSSGEAGGVAVKIISNAWIQINAP